MPQLSIFLRYTPVVIPLKNFHKINTIFRSLSWQPPRSKLEKLQHPKDIGGIAIPNSWLYYIAAQLQNMTGGMVVPEPDSTLFSDYTLAGNKHLTKAQNLAEGLESQLLCKPNKSIFLIIYIFTHFEQVWYQSLVLYHPVTSYEI